MLTIKHTVLVGSLLICSVAVSATEMFDVEQAQQKGYELLGAGRYAESKEYSGAACEKNDAYACQNLGAAFIATGDKEKARTAYDRACKLDSRMCIGLAALEYREGRISIASDLYRSSCDAGHAQACTDLAYLVPNTERKALFEKGCNGGSMEGCSNLGFLLEGTQASESIRLYRKACDASYVKACNNLAFAYYKSGDLAASHKLFETACASGHADACDAASRVAALMRSNPAVQGALRDKARSAPDLER